MAPTTEDERMNSKMAKLKFVLKERLIGNDNNNIEWVFQRLGNLNDKIKSTKFLQSHHAEWIDCTVLHLAALYGYEKAYKTLLNNQADFTIQNKDGATPLHVAIERNLSQGKIIPYYLAGQSMSAHLKYKNFKNPSDKNGLSHFHIACLLDEVELVEQFLNHGVPINHAVNMNSTRYPGYTGLHFAANHRCLEATKTLLANGADLQIKDAKGMTPWQILLKTYFEIADPVSVEKYKCNWPNEADKLILKWARNPRDADFVTQKLVKMIKLFLVHDRQDCIDLSQLHLACTIRDVNETERFIRNTIININHHVDMNSSYWPGYTALHFAAHFDLDTVKLLLKNGANMGAKDARGVTPFDICLRRYDPSDIHTIISLVTDWKKIVLSDGKTRLLDVIHAMTDVDCFKKFLRRLSKNLCVHVPNNSPLWAGFSLLHLAVVVGKIEGDQSMLPILDELFGRAPTLLKHQDVRGCTPLHLSYRLQKDDVTESLVNYHVILDDFTDIVDKEDLSYTHIASTINNSEFLEKLLGNGSDVNAVFRGTSMTWRVIPPGATPLHFAVVHDIKSAMNTLLDYDVDICAKDDNGMTPIHLMVVVNHKNYGRGHVLLNMLDIEDSVVDDVGLSHLHVACLDGYFISTITLIENGANVRQKLSTELITIEGLKVLNEWRGCTPMEIALKKGHQDCVDSFMKTDPEFFANNYELIPEYLAGRYDVFMDFGRLNTDVELQARLKMDFGITTLHLACCKFFHGRYREVKFDDVNAQVREDSPLWPGWTPLHVLLSKTGQFSDEAIDRFVEAGVDVMLANSDGETAVHAAYKDWRRQGKSWVAVKLYWLVNTLLQSQTDFSVNPTSIDGTTHFHIACAVGNADVVEKFLQRGLVDVNRPIDFFHDTEAGQTPLHLAARASIEVASMRLRTVDLLLKNGADVHAENSCGNTALHECVRGKFFDVFERIAKEGADVNARNILGHTPLKYFLSEGKVSVEEVKVLLSVGCHFNTFNPITEVGCLGRALCSIPREEIEALVPTLKDHPTSLIDADDQNRTIFHNIAASADVVGEKYVTLIVELSKIGFDVDDKDKIGRTPLHLAARTEKVQGIATLLASGADVNLTDTIGVTILGYCLRGCYRCRDLLGRFPDIEIAYDIDDVVNGCQISQRQISHN